MATTGSRSFFGEVRFARDIFVGGSIQGGANGINFESPLCIDTMYLSTMTDTTFIAIDRKDRLRPA